MMAISVLKNNPKRLIKTGLLVGREKKKSNFAEFSGTN